MEFETVIGLEVHAELSTNTKAFCSCKVAFGENPNTFCCPVCMGLPGALPKLNSKVVEYGVKMGLVTNCRINKKSLHARKNYFYPDLPKGFQISQAHVPLCEDGFLYVQSRKIRINRIHIEEDAGKLIHEENKTKIDYNRAGVPLIEIVTEPDLRSGNEAKEFLDQIREILLSLEISKCKMQEGNLRCDVNVSVRKKGSNEYGERCEMKNVNSFSAVVNAIEYEEKRQKEIVSKGGTVKRETRRWDDEERVSYLLRDKESIADYRYFTEPDLPCIILSEDYLDEIKKSIPQTPEEKRKKYVDEYNLTKTEAYEIVKVKSFVKLFEEGIMAGGNPKKLYNWIVSDIARILNERDQDEKAIPFSGENLAELTLIIEKGVISAAQGKEVLEAMFIENKSPNVIVKEKHFTQLSDEESLRETVKLVLTENEKSTLDYKNGKQNVLAFLMGQCMRKTQGSANPKILSNILREELNND